MDSFPFAVPTQDADVLGLPAGVPTFLRVQPQAPTAGFDGLAELLHVTRSTVVTMHSRAPDRLPPAFRGPGREPLWIVTDVLAWLRSRPERDAQSRTRTSSNRRAGRPRKAEQIAARRAAQEDQQ